MKKCVVLSMDDTEGEHIYDALLHQPLSNAGWQCDTVSWRNGQVDWNHYDLVMVRSTWDYQLHLDEFMRVLKAIDNSSARLENPLSVIRWNVNKIYLRRLSEQGIQILPTLWQQHYTSASLASYFEQLGCDELVVKPCVSAGAFDTFRIKQAEAEQYESKLKACFQQREFMLQAFADAIVEEGEFSLFYFDGDFSHSILKTPKTGDFRVQEDFGGRLTKVEPEAKLFAAAEKVLAEIGQSLLYARLDFVRHDGGFALMEAELIEPSLYFNLDTKSPQRFVDALERRMQRLERELGLS